jgi:hypothetical protein
LSDFHRQHPRCVRANFVWFFCERDTTDAGAPGRPGLNLDDDFAPYFRRCGHCLLGCSSRAAPWDFESVRGKNRFALIFVQSCHGRVVFRMKTSNVQPAFARNCGVPRTQLVLALRSTLGSLLESIVASGISM